MKRILLMLAGVIAGVFFALPAHATLIDPGPHGPTVVQVSKGDTVAALASQNGTTWWALASYNNLTDPNVIYIGEWLTVPSDRYKPPPQPAPVVLTANYTPARPAPSGPPRVTGGIYSFSALESLWINVGGPSWAAPKAAQIAECESGGKWWAHNPSGATGLWQILGAVVPGDLYDPTVNAENAVRKFRDSNDTFRQWVCQ